MLITSEKNDNFKNDNDRYRIEAIKYVREILGLSLRNAIDLIDGSKFDTIISPVKELKEFRFYKTLNDWGYDLTFYDQDDNIYDFNTTHPKSLRQVLKTEKSATETLKNLVIELVQVDKFQGAAAIINILIKS